MFLNSTPAWWLELGTREIDPISRPPTAWHIVKGDSFQKVVVICRCPIIFQL
jgi:hypothetical protein